MTLTKPGTKHPNELELADYLDNGLTPGRREEVEGHIAVCPECLDTIVAAYEALQDAGKLIKKRKGFKDIMRKFNIYLTLAMVSFILSFSVPQYFVQFLVATLLLGIKWIVDAKSTKMLIMIYDAWKNGGEKEASRVLNALDPVSKKRF